jgi:hypothetical protein
MIHNPRPNKALQVTPVRRATLRQHSSGMSHAMSHQVSLGGAPELGR